MNKCRLATGLFLWTGFIATGEGQTLVDLRTQSKSVDFSAAGSTKPMQTGSSLPSTCAVGQFFFLTTAPAGSNVYACNPVNSWTVEGNSLSVNSSTTNEVLSSNGSSIQWLALGGDITGAPAGLTVNRLQGRNVSNTAPSSGQVLQWNAAANQWQPAPAEAGNSSYAFASQVSITIPGTVHQFGTANLVADCYDNSTPPQQVEPDKVQISPTTYNVTISFSTAQTGYCVVNGVGTASVSGASGPVNSIFGRSGAVMSQAGDYTFSQISGTAGSSQLPAAGGDVSGTLTAATVTGIQNRAVANTAPVNGQAVIWNSNVSTWQPGLISQISGTVASSQLPGAGGDLSGTLTTATVKAIQGQAVSSTLPSNGQALVWNSGATAWQPSTVSGGGAVSSVFGRTGAVTAQTGDYNFGQISGTVAAGQLPGAGGDVSGTLTAATVTGIQSRAVANTAPANGQALVWNSGASAWQPGTVSGSGAVSSVFGRTGAVTAQTGDYGFGQISGSVASSQLPGAGGDVSGNLTAATVTGIQSRAVANTAPANGQALVWNSGASAWQPGTVSGSGAVSSVFGRTGAVTATTGDYGFGQISGTVASGQLPSAGGDLSGTLTSATVKAIQGQPVASTFPSNGQALVWNSAASAWQPSNVSGSGSGASMAYQLGDLVAVRTSSTVLSIGGGCAPTSPCNVRFGYLVYSITNSATATVSGSGIGTAYVYVNSSGTLMVGHNLTVACSAGCTQQSGITSFPQNVLPVYTWTATNGTWDSTGGRDQRAFLDFKVLANGPGIIVTEAPGQTTLTVDNGAIPTYLMNSATLNFPSIATDACAADQTVTVAGANPGDAVAPGWPALPAGVFGIMLVSGTNTVTVRLCNLSGSGVTPPSASYRATIVRNY
jgi:hypothetical protein